MAEQFVGGLRLSNPVMFSRGATFTWPFAQLRLDEKGVVLSVRSLPKWFFGGGGWFDLDPIEIPFEELVWAEPRGRHGVRFHTQTAEERGRHWDGETVRSSRRCGSGRFAKRLSGTASFSGDS